LRDLVPVLGELGDKAEAARIGQAAADFKKQILAALEKSLRRDTDPPFVPIALMGDEDTHDPITHTRIGGYWNLMANYIIGTRLLDGDRRNWLPHYLENHGGLFMGLTRSGAEIKLFGPAFLEPIRFTGCATPSTFCSAMNRTVRSSTSMACSRMALPAILLSELKVAR
jgi:hypothetical protein